MRAARTGRAQADPAIGGTLQVYAFRGRRARSHPLRNSSPRPRAGFAPAYCSQRQERRVHAAAVLAVFGSGVAAFMLPDALKPDIQCVRTHWIRSFMTFQLARRHEGRFARVV